MSSEEKKAAYRAKRRAEETARREALGIAPYSAAPVKPARKAARTTRRGPAIGSQEWAETQADNIGESPDY